MKTTLLTVLFFVSLNTLKAAEGTQADGPPTTGDQAWKDHWYLNKGDTSPLQDAFEKTDLARLWSIFGLASHRQFHGGRTDEELKKAGLTREQILKLNQDIRAKATEYLSLIPGHAKYLGDKVETASDVPNNSSDREAYLELLGLLGSKEAIQQIGRFMFDERRPEHNPQIQYTDYQPPPPNKVLAIWAMRWALKDKAPVSVDKSGIFSNTEMYKIEDWWRSDASLPYRQQLPGVELPVNVRQPPSAADVLARNKTALAKRHAISPEAGGEPLPWYVIVLGLICVGGLTVWLALQRRSPAPQQQVQNPN